MLIRYHSNDYVFGVLRYLHGVSLLRAGIRRLKSENNQIHQHKVKREKGVMFFKNCGLERARQSGRQKNKNKTLSVTIYCRSQMKI